MCSKNVGLWGIREGHDELVGTVGDLLVYLRELYNRTQAQISRKLGVTKQLICQWEEGVTGVPMSELSRIASAYKMSKDEEKQFMSITRYSASTSSKYMFIVRSKI